MAKNTTLKNHELVKRTDGYKVNPIDIKVVWSENPREDYGSTEDFAEFKKMIANEGIKSPILAFVNSDGVLQLAHGFRRMKAVLELIKEGVNITSVPVTQIENNQEAILRAHITMNTGKPMTDLELGETFRRLFNLNGGNVKAIADSLAIDYQKVRSLLDLVNNAGTQLKEAVKENKLSVSQAKEIVKASSSVTEQNEVLQKAKENMTNGQTKIKPKDLKDIKLININIAKTIKDIKSLSELSEDVDTDLINKFDAVLTAIQNKADTSDLIALFTKEAVTA